MKRIKYLSLKKSWNYDPKLPWPVGDHIDNDEDIEIQQILQEHMKDPKIPKEVQTRALLVVHKDKIVGEIYKKNFDKNTPLIGWSLTKSVINAFFGILQKKSLVNIHQFVPIQQWKNDKRSGIAYNHLLQMSSGISFSETYSTFSDISHMLFVSNSTADYYISKDIVHDPGSFWYYSSGSTNTLSYIVKQMVGGTLENYYEFSQKELFSKLGMRSMVMEPDESGNFVGSSFSFATARDWAKFGLLYLKNGVWNGEKIFEDRWVKYTRKPAPASPNNYGSQWWLNLRNKINNQKPYPNLPEDVFYASGFCGQIIMVFPSHDLVIVRLGHDVISGSFEPFLDQIGYKILGSNLLRKGI